MQFSAPRLLGLVLLVVLGACAGPRNETPTAPEANVRPGINDKYYADTDVAHWQKTFETESREIYARRNEIVAAVDLKPGMTVADIGAGTGLFTLLFAEKVGPTGRVIAEDIMPNFITNIETLAAARKLTNVTAVLGKTDDVLIPENSLDLAYICDVYHHFEYPKTTMASIHRALKPGATLVVVDFIRIPGKTPQWILDHVRAGQDVVEKELADAGFEKIDEKPILSENWIARFKRR